MKVPYVRTLFRKKKLLLIIIILAEIFLNTSEKAMSDIVILIRVIKSLNNVTVIFKSFRCNKNSN